VGKLFNNLSFVLIFIFYAISALEINAFGMENTFFDDFDTYTESKELDILIKVSEEVNKDNGSFIFKMSKKSHDSFEKTRITAVNQKKHYYTSPLNYSKSKHLHIHYSVWVI